MEAIIIDEKTREKDIKNTKNITVIIEEEDMYIIIYPENPYMHLYINGKRILQLDNNLISKLEKMYKKTTTFKINKAINSVIKQSKK